MTQVKDNKRHINMRKCSYNQYHNGNGKKLHRLRYLKKVNNITDEELEGCDDIDEKIEYCNIVHIKNKYGITIADIDDNTTVRSVV